jgi:molybdopterin-guanine dinucleotide biosynthesis protein A
MGESKAALFLARVVDAARDVFDEVIAVERSAVIPSVSEGPGRVAREAHASSPARPGPSLDARDDIRVIADEREGAIFGVVRALEDARGKAFLLAVDYPLITSDVLRFLRDDGRMPEWSGKPQPLCAVWDAAWLPRIEERIARGELDLRGAAETEIIPESELRSRFAGEPLLNVNTPEEWERAQRFLASR